MASEDTEAVQPLVPYLKTDASGPYLAGSKCQACGHLFVGERRVCAKCSARDQMSPVRLAERGRLYDFTVVHRSFPGVDTPFVDAIVDLEDGAHLKGTLLEVEPDPEKIAFDMPVKIVYREAVPVGGGGKPYLTYFFVPA
ncbi:MAG: OB-fold domain-containing protein [Pseudomonadales bacterium]|nr:OB-fold domain-containing protein [Pseudomonadales bacterium]MCP5185019.1 OB-fold domain-containing protein [Pseudomonadales bacterium]